MAEKPIISFDEFMKIDLRVGFVKSAEKIPGTTKLIKLIVDLGELGERQLVAGLGLWYKPEDLVNKYIIVVANLAPKKFRGHVSQGMLLAAEDEKGVPILLTVEKPVKPGSRIR
ncbi:MAG: methionine--tRNA ligase subunit beta [Desulfurococcales archaeon]|nr:methionine--tRNA ligase subunit beta [Desulfurococcales archaeon]